MSNSLYKLLYIFFFISFITKVGIVFLFVRFAYGFTTLLIYGCKALLYVYSLESYPTHLRSTGLGINIIMGSLGNVVSLLLLSSIGNFTKYVNVLIFNNIRNVSLLLKGNTNR